MRDLNIDMDVPAHGTGGGDAVILQVSASDVVLADHLLLEPRTVVLSIWSSPFRLNQELTGEVTSYVERRLYVGRKPYMSIWEETKDSIARHIWVFYPGLGHIPFILIHFIRSLGHSFVPF